MHFLVLTLSKHCKYFKIGCCHNRLQIAKTTLNHMCQRRMLLLTNRLRDCLVFKI